jgi:hypothetical protein
MGRDGNRAKWERAKWEEGKRAKWECYLGEVGKGEVGKGEVGKGEMGRHPSDPIAVCQRIALTPNGYFYRRSSANVHRTARISKV